MDSEFVFPADVEGWLTEAEGRALAAAAMGKRVLEIGSYLGRSTICLGQTASHVTAVDPFDGRGTPAPGPTWDGFVSNLERYDIENVVSHKGTADEVCPKLLAASFELVFIDGAHNPASVAKDLNFALYLLRPGGVIAFHDYRSGIDPGVDKVVEAFVKEGATLVSLVGTVAFCKPSSPEQRFALDVKDYSNLLIGTLMPHGTDGVRSTDAAKAFYGNEWPGRIQRLMLDRSTSLAIRTFNMLLCDILNARRDIPGLTHVAMMHDDICPAEGYLTDLVDEQERTGCDFLSAVVPIKNGLGLTTTAVDLEFSPWAPRRLSMTEVCELPETFGLEDIPWRMPDSVFLVNSGLWLWKIGDKFNHIFPVKNPLDCTRKVRLCFQDHAKIMQLDTGEYVALDISEDWDWSRQLHALGMKCMATRKVQLYHERREFHNRSPWGAWKVDEGYFKTIAALKGKKDDRDKAGSGTPAQPGDATCATARTDAGG